MSVWLGVDPGEKRIGVARSDGLGLAAHPVAIVESREALVEAIERARAEYEVAGVVVGLPRNMDGTIGPIARRSFDLVSFLRARLPLVFYLWDERLTTRVVELRAGRRRAEPLDDRAAAALLQTFLDAGAPCVPDPPEFSK